MMVCGSHGTLTIDDMGVVVDYAPADGSPEYEDIVCVDLAEYREAYGADGATSFDILDVGFWTAAGDYVVADEYHRQLVREDMQSILLTPVASQVLIEKLPRA